MFAGATAAVILLNAALAYAQELQAERANESAPRHESVLIAAQ